MTRQRSTTCSTRSRAGLTLIEVVAALAILGTLLVGIVLARARHTDQLLRARVQARAVEAADEMIARWWASREGVPIDASGELAGGDGLLWRTSIVDEDGIAELGARVVRVEVLQARGDGRRLTDDGGALFVVDLVVPDPAVEARERQAAEEQEKKNRGAGDA